MSRANEASSCSAQFELTMDGAHWPVLPMLMPPTWTAPAYVGIPLMRNVIATVPVLTLAHVVEQPLSAEGPPKRVVHGAAWLASHRTTFGAVLQVALANLAARPATWQSMGPHMLACRDDYLAPERVLLPAFLGAAAVRLRAVSGLVVAIPQRGVLMATPTEVFVRNRAHAMAFHRLARQVFDRATGDELYPYPLQTDVAGQVTAVWDALP